MELSVITLQNGMRAVVGGKPEPTPEQSAFAAELEQAAEAAKRAEASGSTKVQAAWCCMTPSSKSVLERMKAGGSRHHRGGVGPAEAGVGGHGTDQQK